MALTIGGDALISGSTIMIDGTSAKALTGVAQSVGQAATLSGTSIKLNGFAATGDVAGVALNINGVT